MGNQLCEATEQSSYKAKIMEICNGVDNKDAKLKLEPITFSDHGSARDNAYRDDDNDDEVRESSIDHFPASKESFSPMLKNKNEPSSFITESNEQQSEPNSKNEKTSSNSADYLSSSPTKKTRINFDYVYLKHMNSQHEEGNLNYQPIPVPFSVIKLMLSKSIVPFIEEEKQKFFRMYENDQTSFKLYKQGYYGHLLSENSGIFVNKDYFYQGSFILKEKKGFLPHDQGTYITSEGKYTGQFREGRSHGNGKYVQFGGDDFNKNTTYSGQWQNGSLSKGTVENYLFRYEGELKNRKPHGMGKIYMKVTNTSYSGQFKDGKFHGSKGFYETAEYTYAGDFQNGKKHGRGVLSEKMSAMKNFNRKVRQEERYQGNWKEDRLEERIVIAPTNGQ